MFYFIMFYGGMSACAEKAKKCTEAILAKPKGCAKQL